MAIRNIIKIDEDKCTGCGLCIPSCAEGALAIVDGKAKIVKDIYCDGLGACLGECPEGALTIIERDADEFDEAATQVHLKEIRSGADEDAKDDIPAPGFQCPSSKATAFGDDDSLSELKQWPIKIDLLAPKAPYFKDANLLITADCVPFAHASFHKDILKGNVVAIGCPKLNDREAYLNKIAAIIKENDLKSVTVVHMEVPCCFGLDYVVEKAIELSGKDVTKKKIIVSMKGNIVDSV